MMLRIFSDFLINVSATWFSAIFIIPQLTIIHFKSKILTIVINLVWALSLLIFAILLQWHF
jgi:hypothetical protein